MTTSVFRENWFEGQRSVWESVINPLFSNRSYCRALEIGSWEGASACWILQNLCTGDDERNSLVCVDHFDLMQTAAGCARWAAFQANIKSTQLSKRVRVMPEFSTPALFKLMSETLAEAFAGYNFVYIDGSHRADDALLDAEMAWRLAANECVMVFDDYEWNQADERTVEHPKPGIRGFLSAHPGEYVRLHKGYQIIIQKKVPLRLGFLA